MRCGGFETLAGARSSTTGPLLPTSEWWTWRWPCPLAVYPETVLTISQATYDAIVAHAKRDHPDEACGVVAGPEGSDRATRFVEMINAAG